MTFPSRLGFEIPANRVTYVGYAASPTAECPGLGEVVPVGWACFYEMNADAVSLGNIFQQDAIDGGNPGISRDGFGIYFDCSSDSCFAYGRWTIRAPVAALPLPPRSRAGQSVP